MSHIHRTRLITTRHIARTTAMVAAAVFVWHRWPTDQQVADYSFARRRP